MIVEYVRYQLPADQVDAFVAAYQTASESLRASPHCLAYDLARCAEARETFILRIHWDSAEGHMHGFRQSEDFKPFLAAVRPFMPHLAEMRHYEPTALSWAR